MADSSQLRPFAPDVAGRRSPQTVLPAGVTALLRQRTFHHASFSLPVWDEHVLLVHLKHRSQVALRLDREYEFSQRPRRHHHCAPRPCH